MREKGELQWKFVVVSYVDCPLTGRKQWDHLRHYKMVRIGGIVSNGGN
jgi:hypothetical protein